MIYIMIYTNKLPFKLHFLICFWLTAISSEKFNVKNTIYILVFNEDFRIDAQKLFIKTWLKKQKAVVLIDILKNSFSNLENNKYHCFSALKPTISFLDFLHRQ